MPFPGHPPRPPRDQGFGFQLDASTAHFRDAIISEGYQANLLSSSQDELPSLSRLDILRLARDAGCPLLTADSGYINIATEDNNGHGILILPESFQRQQEKFHNAARLRSLLRDHENVRKVRQFPIKVYMAEEEGTTWKIEEVSGME